MFESATSKQRAQIHCQTLTEPALLPRAARLSSDIMSDHGGLILQTQVCDWENIQRDRIQPFPRAERNLDGNCCEPA